MAPKDDIPNSVLGRVFSLQFLGMLVVIGISWGSITARVSGLENQIADNKTTSTQSVVEMKSDTTGLKAEVATINRKLDVMGNNQDHFKEQINQMDNRLDRMLTILEKDVKQK